MPKMGLLTLLLLCAGLVACQGEYDKRNVERLTELREKRRRETTETKVEVGCNKKEIEIPVPMTAAANRVDVDFRVKDKTKLSCDGTILDEELRNKSLNNLILPLEVEISLRKWPQTASRLYVFNERTCRQTAIGLGAYSSSTGIVKLKIVYFYSFDDGSLLVAEGRNVLRLTFKNEKDQTIEIQSALLNYHYHKPKDAKALVSGETRCLNVQRKKP